MVLLKISSSYEAVFAAASLFAFYAVIRIVYLLCFHPLARFPGPKLAAVSNLWYAKLVWSKRIPFHILEAHRKYGPIVRIAPNELSFNTNSSRNAIYGHSASRKFPKSPLYDGFVNNGVPSLVGVKDPVAHGKKRKFLAHAFSSAALKSHQPTVQFYADTFITQILKYGTGEEGVNLSHWFHWFTADVAGDLAFGNSFNCLQNVKADPWVALIHNHALTIMWKDVLRRFPLISPIIQRFIVTKEMAAARAQNYANSRAMVAKRMAMKTDRKDFMSYLLNQPDEDNMLGEAFLTVSASTFVVAGSETTSSALAGIMYWILRTPHAQKKIILELEDRYQSDEDINTQNVHELEYLCACIEEGLRMFPPAPNGPPRISPGTEISGHYIPAGTEVSSHPMALNRNPLYFHDPEKFLPERWMEKTDELAASMPFLIGPRACIGRNLAYLEMRLLLAKLFYNLDLTLLDDDLDWDRDTRANAFWDNPALNVRVQKRVHS